MKKRGRRVCSCPSWAKKAGDGAPRHGGSEAQGKAVIVPPTVALTGITFVRDGKPILRGIDWTICAGEHWALLGANGSGKTTLLKILTGYAWPTSGSVRVLGKVYGECDLRELRKTIGWVSNSIEQRFPAKDSALKIVVSGFDASLGVYRTFSEEEMERGRKALDMMSAGAVASQAFETLSQGEQQRALIARGLVNEPALLVLDEPCAGLDPVARADFLDDLSILVQQPDAPTIVLVTHHIEEIGPWISHVLAIREGAGLRSGPRESVLTSETLSEAFGRTCSVESSSSGYRLAIGDDGDRPG